ncbi:DUF4258 domain-containing protein [Ginsengibacter hankyongi]|uniref:DUF4258 domain-containing protein n=1 Tax=Ginsengibacter hankyongi TaxID=2607284 RepID=A0A5J5IHN8_9BACT|nr:DUF4258 domain-containing protein [Ginsengibacter hankyongi]KAA9039078.1 DUF4258 domain-containing protein [Ginsengibacter hankyongi]
MNKRKNALVLIIIVAALLIIKLLAFYRQEHTVVNPSNKDSFRNTTHLILTKHAKCRMDCRHITEDEIREIIHDGRVNEAKSGPGTKGDETYALEGYSDERQHLRIIVAPENDGLVVITCIDLDNEWACNCN